MDAKLDQFLVRGVGEAVSKVTSMEDGRRGVLLLTRGMKTDVVERVTNALACWEISEVFFVGVTDLQPASKQARGVDNTTAFINLNRLITTTYNNRLNAQCTKHIFLKAPATASETKPLAAKEDAVAWHVYPSTGGISNLCETAEVLGSIYDSVVQLAETDNDLATLATSNGKKREEYLLETLQRKTHAKVQHRQAGFGPSPHETEDHFTKKETKHMTLPIEGDANFGDIKLVQRFQTEVCGLCKKSVKDGLQKLDSHFHFGGNPKSSLDDEALRRKRTVFGIRKGNLNAVSHLVLLINGGQVSGLQRHRRRYQF